MALNMLVGGADCGPSNPLQNLSKRFDQDRGAQQDHFGARRSGISLQTFRTQQQSPSNFNQDAALFFSSKPAPSQPTAFDLGALQHTLPSTHSDSSWAADFVQADALGAFGKAGGVRLQEVRGQVQSHYEQQGREVKAVGLPQGQPGHMQWNPVFAGNQFPTFAPMLAPPSLMSGVQADQSLWDQEFQSQETALSSQKPTHSDPLTTQNAPAEASSSQEPATRQIDEELARTAGQLVETVKDEVNPKFKESAFMGLMRQLRDGEVVVDGDRMVEAGPGSVRDVKGKGRVGGTGQIFAARDGMEQGHEEKSQVDPNDAYFLEENEEFMRYWNDHHDTQNLTRAATWDYLQEQWDRFEATSVGIKPVDTYQFQSNNPYMLGNSSNSVQRQRNVHETLLELEAAVQRDPTNARAWFDLGVKQQENEREQKAIQALKRALELDPAHLPSWLALAISHTNNGNRAGTYDAIKEWVERNGRYKTGYRATLEGKEVNESPEWMVGCLIEMARSEVSAGEVDPDVQIALAILLNTVEDFQKAQDCFQAALAVRPDDWLLYNRVGATMANSGRAKEALEFYHRALELNPAYIRARYNLGISCSNLRRYEEAAQHLLDALVLQDADGVREPENYSGFGGEDETRGVTSGALWDTLKTVCLNMQRIELATLCDMRDLDGFGEAWRGLS